MLFVLSSRILYLMPCLWIQVQPFSTTYRSASFLQKCVIKETRSSQTECFELTINFLNAEPVIAVLLPLLFGILACQIFQVYFFDFAAAYDFTSMFSCRYRLCLLIQFLCQSLTTMSIAPSPPLDINLELLFGSLKPMYPK